MAPFVPPFALLLLDLAKQLLEVGPRTQRSEIPRAPKLLKPVRRLKVACLLGFLKTLHGAASIAFDTPLPFDRGEPRILANGAGEDGIYIGDRGEVPGNVRGFLRHHRLLFRW